MLKPYTMWRLDDSTWLLEVEDDKLADHMKYCMDNATLKLERFGVGINSMFRAFKVKNEDVLPIDEYMEKFLKKK